MRTFAILVLALSISAGLSVTAPSSSAQSDRFVIYPGEGIGPVRLGMNVQRDVIPLLGAWIESRPASNDTVRYRWYKYEEDANGVHHGGGLGLFTRQDVVYNVYVYHDPRYTIKGIHTGSTEAQVRSALGEPLQIQVGSSTDPTHVPPRRLKYRGMMLSVGQTSTDPDGDYQKVFYVQVLQP